MSYQDRYIQHEKLCAQVKLATQAMNEMFYHGHYSMETVRTMKHLKITWPRFNAMVRFIETKGPPRQ